IITAFRFQVHLLKQNKIYAVISLKELINTLFIFFGNFGRLAHAFASIKKEITFLSQSAITYIPGEESEQTILYTQFAVMAYVFDRFSGLRLIVVEGHIGKKKQKSEHDKGNKSQRDFG